MIGPLWRKELREHGWLLVALLAGNALGFAALTITELKHEGALEALRRFVLLFGTIDALFLCNRLVVREYGGATQLFLETLPVTRGRVLWSKFSLGVLALLVVLLGATGVAGRLAAGRDLITPEREGWLVCRGGLYLLCGYSFAFFSALLGRMRIYAWGSLFVFVYAVEELTQTKMKGLPLISVMADRFTRGAPTGREVLALLGSCAALWLASIGLALGRDGLVASYLAQRMTPRGKVISAGVGLLGLLVLSMLDDRKVRPPFELNAAGRAETKAAQVAVGVTSQESKGDAQDLARRLARGLGAMREALDLRKFPPVFVLPAADVDPGVFERVDTTTRDGVAVRAGPSDLANPGELERRLGREVIRWSTRGALPEEYEWLAEGYMERRALPSPAQALRVAWAFRQASLPHDGKLLRQWHRTREQLGPCVAGAVAGAAVEALSNRVGPEAWSALARETLGRRPPDDVRALSSWPRLDAVLQQHQAPSPDWLVAEIVRTDPDVAMTLRTLAWRSARFESVPVGARSKQREVHWHLSGPAIPLRVLYRAILPWTEEIGPQMLLRVDVAGEHDGALPIILPRGELFFAALELDEPVLGCAVRLGTFRGTLE